MPNPGGSNQYVSQHIDNSHGVEPVEIRTPATDLTPKYLAGFFNLSNQPAVVYLFDGGPHEDFLMGDAITIAAGDYKEFGNPGFPLTGSGLWVRAAKILAPGAKLHVLVR